MAKWQKMNDKILQMENIIKSIQTNIDMINNKVSLLETKIQNLEKNNKTSKSFFDKLFCC